MTVPETNIVRLKNGLKPVELTVRRISSLKPRAQRYQIRDTKVSGLLVRVYPSGSTVFYLHRRVGTGRGAKQVFTKLGSTQDISLADARKRANVLIADVSQGNDPTAAQMGDIPLRELIELYDKRLKARQVVKRVDVITCLQTYLKPHLVQRAGDLTRQQVIAIIDRTEEAGKRGAAEYLRKCTTGLLNWAVDKGYLKASVMAGYRRERATRAERAGNGRFVLKTPEQILTFWRATESASSAVFRDLLRFLLLTGQRRTETAAMRWQDLDGNIWSIPATITKMGREHRVPLGPLSMALIGAQERVAGTDLVFVGRRHKQISGWTQQLAPVREAAEMSALAPHALRRTFRTGLSELGLQSEVAEVMIAHQRDDLISRYNHAELWDTRKEAQRRWEEHVAEIVGD